MTAPGPLPGTPPPDREALIAAATEIHDAACGCDRTYRMSCPVMANAILEAGRRLREAPPPSTPTPPVTHLLGIDMDNMCGEPSHVTSAVADATCQPCIDALRKALTGASEIAWSAQEAPDAGTPPPPGQATPPEALADELEAEAAAPSDSPRHAYRAMMLGDFAELIRERLVPQWEALAAERDKLSASGIRLMGLIEMYVRSLCAVKIDVVRGDTKAVMEALSEGLDGFDGPEWDGTETGQQWLERTQETEATHD